MCFPNDDGIDTLVRYMYVLPDSIPPRGYGIFKGALEEDAEYTWIIGAETLHTRVVQRSGFPKGETIPITLIVKKTPNAMCFPNDDGIDTLVRYMHVLPDSIPPRGYGVFRGTLDEAPLDTFTVSILRKETSPGLFDDMIYNLGMKGCEVYSSTVIGFRQIAFHVKHINCDRPQGWARVSADDPNEITINYSFDYGEHKGKWFVFKGIRQ